MIAKQLFAKWLEESKRSAVKRRIKAAFQRKPKCARIIPENDPVDVGASLEQQNPHHQNPTENQL